MSHVTTMVREDTNHGCGTKAVQFTPQFGCFTYCFLCFADIIWAGDGLWPTFALSMIVSPNIIKQW
jgi:hypothetical protein